MIYEIVFFRTEGGRAPLLEFLDSLDPKLRAKVVRDLSLLEANGPRLGEPFSKSLGDGIFELRSKQASNIVRSLYFFFDGRRIVITHGFLKKTQKTPRGEIDRAKRYRDEWRKRIHE